MSDPFDDRTETFNPEELLFRAQQKSAPVAAILTCLSGAQRGKTYVLRHGLNIIGRSEAAGVRVNASGVSRKHAKIVEKDGTYTLSDMGSANGTICGDRLIDGPVLLADGDRIVLGLGAVLRFSRVDALEEEVTAELFEQATRDPLTAVHNRRYLDDRLNSEWPWARRHDRPCAVVMFDLDHFKSVNDSHGHAAGDYVLRELARIVQQQIRKEDVLARVGGEEFVVLCRETAASDAAVLGERLRNTVEHHAFTWHGERLAVTISAGVATSLEAGVTTAEELVERADRRLYRAKELGRNQIVMPESDSGQPGGLVDSFPRKA